MPVDLCSTTPDWLDKTDAHQDKRKLQRTGARRQSAGKKKLTMHAAAVFNKKSVLRPQKFVNIQSGNWSDG
jgi:hypothetical protein